MNNNDDKQPVNNNKQPIDDKQQLPPQTQWANPPDMNNYSGGYEH